MTPETACAFFLHPRRAAMQVEDDLVPGAAPFAFDYDGMQLRGQVAGEGAKTVLLVHGWESRAAHLHGFLSALQQAGFRVAAFDGPAHGNSEGKKGDVAEMGKAVLAARESIGRIDAVIAHSAGSPAALYAMTHGLRVAASVHLAGPASFERVLQRFAAACGLDDAAFLRFRGLVHEALGIDPALLEEDAITRGLDHPALLIHDAADKEVPFEESRRLQARWPGAELVPVTGLGHRRIIQDGEVIRNAVTFLVQKLT